MHAPTPNPTDGADVLEGSVAAGPGGRGRVGYLGGRGGWVLVVGMLVGGCRTAPVLPAVDVGGPGWEVRQGQAVWWPGGRGEPLAGEIWLATGGEGRCMVQFMKTPLPLVSARQEPGGWRLEWGAGARVRGGRGQAPGRWVWFQVARVEAGLGVGEWWRLGRRADASWELRQVETGERLEVWWDP